MYVSSERKMDGWREGCVDGWVERWRISECMRTCVYEWVDSWVHR